MKITFLEPLGISEENLSQRISAKVDADITYHKDRKEDNETLIERAKDSEVVVLSNIKFTKEVMEKCTKLKMICVAFTGYDHIDMEYCKMKGIKVCNCAGYSTIAVAELVFGMVISHARNIVACDKRVRENKTKDGLVGYELYGKKFGVIGLGAIGKRVASIANAFGCEVYATSRTKKDIENVKFVEMETLLKECDIVSLHVPQNAETLDLISEKELSLMKKTAILVNTARGPVVNSKDLAKALKEGTIAGACIDVFEIEPPINASHELLNAPNVLATPHIAFASEQAFEKRADIVASNIKSWIDGELQNEVN